MSKPQKNTPVAHVVSLLFALPDWYATHAAALADGLDDDFDAPDELDKKHAALKVSQETFEREQKEDQQATTHIEALLAQSEALLGSLNRALLSLLRKHPQRKRLMRQFLEDSPSEHRSPTTMIKALRLASDGLKRHAALFSKRQSLHARLIARADQLIVALDDADKARKKEQVESRAAGTDRDAALKDALDLITELDDAAQTNYFDDPAPYNALRTLYAVHCPAPLNRSAEDDDIEGEDEVGEPGSDGPDA